MKTRTGEKIKLQTIDELLGVPNGETAEEISVSNIHEFGNHPFKVIDDDNMHELTESILANGILTPVIVRMIDGNEYEMISGHRRMHAAKIVGLDTLPAIVRNMTDEEATIAMVDSNLQREKILPSEKAHAYKMRYEAMRKKAGRPSKNSSQLETNLRADEVLAAQVGESRAQVQRFLRIATIIPELLDLVDKERIAITTAVDISFLDEKMQKWIYEYICDNGVLKSFQIAELRRAVDDYENITQAEMIRILNENLPARIPSHKVSFTSKKMLEYFPAYYTASEIEAVILNLLSDWKKEQGGRK